MSEHESWQDRVAGKKGWITFAVATLFAVVGGYAISKVVQDDRGGSVIVGSGGIEFQVPARASLKDLIDQIAAEQTGAAEALLGNKGYFRLNSLDWVEKLRVADLDPEVERRFRELLYDLKGPFEPEEEALAGSDERLMKALLALREQAEGIDPAADEVANAFLARILIDSLEHKGVFAQRSFNTEITLIAGPDGRDRERHVVYACPGSVFEGKEATLLNREMGRSISATVIVDSSRFSVCPSTRSMRELLANRPGRLGLPKLAFSALYGEVEGGGTLPPRLSAVMQVLPRHYTAVARRFTTN